MSARTVRAQLQAFLSAPAIPGLEKVFVNQPWFVDGGAWKLSDQAGWGAICWPHITDDSEERITLGAPIAGVAAGQKAVTYKVALAILFQYLIPAQVASEDAWSPLLDDLIDAVKARLRSDPTAGTGTGLGNVIFEQSQDPGDLKVARDVPKRTPGKVMVWTMLETTVREIITA